MSLKIGDKVRHFKSVDTNGNEFESQDFLGKQWLVLYFYPKDDTPGCTTQACSFRDSYQDFKDLGAEVIGVSSDTVQSHIKFKSKFNLPFILLSDTNKVLRNLFGVPNDFFGLVPGRATYVIDSVRFVQHAYVHIGYSSIHVCLLSLNCSLNRCRLYYLLTLPMFTFQVSIISAACTNYLFYTNCMQMSVCS